MTEVKPATNAEVGPSSSPQDDQTPPRNASDSGSNSLAIGCLFLLAVILLGWPIVRKPTELLFSAESDIIGQHWPFRHLLCQSLRNEGRLPLWNPTAFGGMPMVGDPQSGIFYPIHWLHALLPPDSTMLLFGPLILFHCWIGAVATFYWLRARDLPVAAAFAGALTFIGFGKWWIHIFVPGHLVFLPLVWLPAICWGIDRCNKAPSSYATLLLAGSSALMVLGLHPQLLFYSCWFLAGYILFSWKLSDRRVWIGLGHFLFAAGLAVLLSAIHLIPIFEGLAEYGRGGGLPLELAARYGAQWSDWPNFLLPGHVGKNPWETTIYLGVAITWLLLLGLTRLLEQPQRILTIYCASFLLFCYGYALGTNSFVYAWCYEYLPGFSLFRIPTRILLVAGLPASWLVAQGVAALDQSLSRLQWLFVAGLGLGMFGLVIPFHGILDYWLAFGIVLLLTLFSWLSSWRPSWRYTLVWCLVGLLFVDIYRYAAYKVATKAVSAAVPETPVLAAVQGQLGSWRVLGLNYDRPGFRTSLPIHYATLWNLESVRGFNPLINRDLYQYLYEGVGQTSAEPNYSTGIREFPIRRRIFLDLLNVRYLVTNQPLERTEWWLPELTVQLDESLAIEPAVSNPDEKAPFRVLAEPITGLRLRQEWSDLAVYHFASRSPEITKMPHTYLYENLHYLPRAYLVPKSAPVESFVKALERVPEIDVRETVLLASNTQTPDYPGSFQPVPVDHQIDTIQIDIETSTGGYLILSEIAFPGWKAYSQGKQVPIIRANALFQAVVVAPGKTTFQFHYRPDGYIIGKWCTGLGIVLMFGFLLWDWRRLKTRTEMSNNSKS